MLGQLAGQDEPNGCLDFTTGDGGFLVVACQGGGLGANLLENVVDEGVHDGHGFGGDTSVLQGKGGHMMLLERGARRRAIGIEEKEEMVNYNAIGGGR